MGRSRSSVSHGDGSRLKVSRAGWPLMARGTAARPVEVPEPEPEPITARAGRWQPGAAARSLRQLGALRCWVTRGWLPVIDVPALRASATWLRCTILTGLPRSLTHALEGTPEPRPPEDGGDQRRRRTR